MPAIRPYLDRHVELREAEGRARSATIAKERRLLERIAEWWGDPALDTIALRHLNDLKVRLKGKSGQTVSHHLTAVSTLLQNAASDGYVAVNVARSVKRPKIRRDEVPYIESADGHALLVAAAALDADPEYRGFRPLEALVGTFLLTGGRRREVFALLVVDIDFDAGFVHFRPNAYYSERKSRHAVRRVPLWPQLRHLLVPVVSDRAGGLLFAGRGEKPLVDLRGSLAKLFKQAKLAKPAGKELHLFRHTYTAMRLQTLDQGAPVSLYTVAKELGHGSVTLIEQTYGHLLDVRQRLPVVEYRPVTVAQESEAKRA